MHLSEKMAFCLFGAVIAVVYYAEASILLRCCFKKLTYKNASKLFLSRRAIVIHILALLGFGCFAYGCFIEPYWLQVNSFYIPTDKLDHAEFTVVQISDTHCDKKTRNEDKLLKIINDLEPDIIVFTGDSINTPRALKKFKDTMTVLNAPLGKFAVCGNIDVYYFWNTDLFSSTGFTPLHEKTVKLTKNGETILLTGLTCDRTTGVNKTLEKIPNDKFSLLLYHRPALIEDLQNLNVDLYLAGHTHGGQIALPFYGAIITLSKHGKKYESGFYTVGDTTLYINRGIGMEGGLAPRVRFMARPEITLFTIGPKKQAKNN